MKLKDAEKLLDEFTDKLVEAIGFRRIDRDTFGCIVNDAMVQLSFPCLISAQGSGLFTILIGLRFESIAKWIDEYPEEKPSTIGMPLHFLRDDKTYKEWEFSDINDLEKLHVVILMDLKKYAFPYIEHYSDLSNLRNILESPNKQDWLSAGLNVDSRVTVLATIQFVQGERDNAIKTLDEGLKNLEEALAGRYHELRKRRFAMEYLRDRFLREKEGTK